MQQDPFFNDRCATITPQMPGVEPGRTVWIILNAEWILKNYKLDDRDVIYFLVAR